MPLEERKKQIDDEIQRIEADIDFLRVNSLSIVSSTEKRQIVECITNKITLEKRRFQLISSTSLLLRK